MNQRDEMQPEPIATEDRQREANADEPADARKHGRVVTEFLHALHGGRKYGVVVNLSATGARIFRKGSTPLPDGSCTNFVLQWNELAVPIKVRVVWSRKTGFRKHLFGVQFEDVNPSQQAALAEICRASHTWVHIASEQFEPQRHAGRTPSPFEWIK